MLLSWGYTTRLVNLPRSKKSTERLFCAARKKEHKPKYQSNCPIWYNNKTKKENRLTDHLSGHKHAMARMDLGLYYNCPNPITKLFLLS